MARRGEARPPPEKGGLVPGPGARVPDERCGRKRWPAEAAFDVALFCGTECVTPRGNERLRGDRNKPFPKWKKAASQQEVRHAFCFLKDANQGQFCTAVRSDVGKADTLNEC